MEPIERDTVRVVGYADLIGGEVSVSALDWLCQIGGCIGGFFLAAPRVPHFTAEEWELAA